jgi:membrane-associated PAP2 superfamily phosphatase
VNGHSAFDIRHSTFPPVIIARIVGLRRHWYWWWSLAVLGPLLVVCSVTRADMWVCGWFFDGRIGGRMGWLGRRVAALDWFERWGEWPTIVAGIVAALGIVYTWLPRRTGAGLRWPVPDHFWGLFEGIRGRAFVMVLVASLGAGVMVNAVIKPLWERTRPIDLREFREETSARFHYWWQPGGEGNSFVSGHAASGFAMVAAAGMISRQRRKWRAIAYTAALTWAAWLSLTRVMAGKPLPSAVTPSALLILGMTAVLERVFVRPPPREAVP